MLLVGYPHLPKDVMLYRPPWGQEPLTAPKSPFSVGRLALMGVGQLGAATAMSVAVRSSASWLHFWLGLGLVAGMKTLLECAGLFAAEGSPLGWILTLSTFAVVGLFVLSALRWWRQGVLGAHPPVGGGPRIWLVASLALWAACAFAPLVGAW